MENIDAQSIASTQRCGNSYAPRHPAKYASIYQVLRIAVSTQLNFYDTFYFPLQNFISFSQRLNWNQTGLFFLFFVCFVVVVFVVVVVVCFLFFFSGNDLQIGQPFLQL